MRAKILTLILGLALIGYVPLMAQVQDDPLPQEPPVAQEESTETMPAEQPQESVTTEYEYEDPASTEAETLGAPTDEEGMTEELPATASVLPLLALLGGAGVASATVLRLRRKK